MLRWFPLACFLVALPLLAQTPAVSRVTNFAAPYAFNTVPPFAGIPPGAALPALSPGSLAAVWVDNLKGQVSVRVGGLPTPVLYAHPQWVLVQLPAELEPGMTTVTAAADGGTSVPFGITLDAYAPLLTGLSGCNTSGMLGEERATAGETVRVFAVGLGATNPIVASGTTPAMALPTLAKPGISIGGKGAEVVSSVLVPWQPGIYQIDFKIPTGLGEGLQPVVLSVAGKSTNAVNLNVTLGRVLYLDRAAPESITTVKYCGGLALATVAGDARNPGTTLGGTTVKVKDAAGVERSAAIRSVSAGEVSYVVPAGTARGTATVTVTAGDGTVSIGSAEIAAVVPSLFCGNASCDYPLASAVRIRNGNSSTEIVSEGPIDLGPESDQVIVQFFGTGLRFRSALARVSMGFYTRNGVIWIPVDYAGAQGEYAGLDQVNVRLPRSFAGAGVVGFDIVVDDESAIFSWLNFK